MPTGTEREIGTERERERERGKELADVRATSVFRKVFDL